MQSDADWEAMVELRTRVRAKMAQEDSTSVQKESARQKQSEHRPNGGQSSRIKGGGHTMEGAEDKSRAAVNSCSTGGSKGHRAGGGGGGEERVVRKKKTETLEEMMRPSPRRGSASSVGIPMKSTAQPEEKRIEKKEKEKKSGSSSMRGGSVDTAEDRIRAGKMQDEASNYSEVASALPATAVSALPAKVASGRNGVVSDGAAAAAKDGSHIVKKKKKEKRKEGTGRRNGDDDGGAHATRKEEGKGLAIAPPPTSTDDDVQQPRKKRSEKSKAGLVKGMDTPGKRVEEESKSRSKLQPSPQASDIPKLQEMRTLSSSLPPKIRKQAAPKEIVQIPDHELSQDQSPFELIISSQLQQVGARCVQCGGQAGETLACDRCGDHFHRTCLDAAGMVRVMQVIPWICSECYINRCKSLEKLAEQAIRGKRGAPLRMAGVHQNDLALANHFQLAVDAAAPSRQVADLFLLSDAAQIATSFLGFSRYNTSGTGALTFKELVRVAEDERLARTVHKRADSAPPTVAQLHQAVDFGGDEKVDLNEYIFMQRERLLLAIPANIDSRLNQYRLNHGEVKILPGKEKATSRWRCVLM